LERNIEFFGLGKQQFPKKEADIVVFSPDQQEKHCIEIKFPRSGQYPEQMFAACKDVLFLEQLVAASWDASYFLMLADDHLFWEGGEREGIYGPFRAGKPIQGDVTKPTGSRDQVLHFEGQYSPVWWDLKPGMRYLLVEVHNRTAERSE